MPRHPSSRKYLLTINNPVDHGFTHERIKTILSNFPGLLYWCMCDEIGELKDVCGEKKLKVILETGALITASNIKKAAILAMYSGADFIKTSTGKEAISATPEAALVMCEAIKEYYKDSGFLDV